MATIPISSSSSTLIFRPLSKTLNLALFSRHHPLKTPPFTLLISAFSSPAVAAPPTTELFDSKDNNEVERLRGERNDVANKMKCKLEPSERQKLIEEGKKLKDELMTLEEDLINVRDELRLEAQCIPNMMHPDSSKLRNMVI